MSLVLAHYTLTLTGSVQTLAAANGNVNLGVIALELQPDPANTHVVYVGGSHATLSSSNYGVCLEVPVSSIPQAPWSPGPPLPEGFLELREVCVLGTNTEKIHISAILKDSAVLSLSQ